MNQKHLKSLFDYDEDGYLIRKISGKRLGCLNGKYLRGRIEKKNYYVHRLVYLYHKGSMPRCIDHINGKHLDNRIENLRPATHSENQWNRPKNTNNSSGHKNIGKTKSGRWIVSMERYGKRYRGGSYEHIEDAVKAAQVLRERLHGEYSKA